MNRHHITAVFGTLPASAARTAGAHCMDVETQVDRCSYERCLGGRSLDRITRRIGQLRIVAEHRELE